MINPNTSRFWNKKNILEKRMLSNSPIFIDKNRIVVNFLKRLNGELLNIGIGHGALERLLMQKTTRINFFGIDISKRAIENIKRIVNGEYIIANVLKIPFSNNQFDLVVELDVLEHLRKDEAAKSLQEIKRVIKGKGFFIISVPLNESNIDRILNRHLTLYDENEILRLLGKHGFKIVKIERLYAFRKYYRVKSLLSKLFKVRKPNLIILFCKKP